MVFLIPNGQLTPTSNTKWVEEVVFIDLGVGVCLTITIKKKEVVKPHESRKGFRKW